MRPSNLSRHQALHELAKCIAFAKALAGGNESSKSDVYWHTREKVMEIARSEYGFRIPEVLGCYKSQFTFGCDTRPEDNPFWFEVMHPDHLAAEVHTT